MSTTLMDKIHDGLADARKKLDSLRLNAALLKLEAREKKDDVLADLERHYTTVRHRAAEAAATTGAKAETAKAAVHDAWSAFQARLQEATVDDTSASA